LHHYLTALCSKAEGKNQIIMGLTIQTNDQVVANIDVTSLSIDDSGNVTVNYQKVLVDNTDGSQENDGAPQTLTLQPADAQNLLDAIEPVLTPLVSGAPAGTSGSSTTSTSTTTTQGS